LVPEHYITLRAAGIAQDFFVAGMGERNTGIMDVDYGNVVVAGVDLYGSDAGRDWRVRPCPVLSRWRT
jgi:hypothetical protein